MVKETQYGKVEVMDLEGIFERMLKEIEDVLLGKDKVVVALTGGSTPKAFYKYVVEGGYLTKEMKDKVIWTVSDERCVWLESDESNFGNAERMMLEPCGVGEEHMLPWDMGVDPEIAAEKMNKYFGGGSYDLCFLGMGGDCHTASLFPGQVEDVEESFMAINVKDKGWRLTVTPKGLERCGKVVTVVTGESKSGALKEVLQGAHNTREKPAQLHAGWSERHVWLVDHGAAMGI